MLLELSNLLVEITESIAVIKVRVLEEAVRGLFAIRRLFVITASLSSRILRIIHLILSSTVIGRRMKQLVSRCFKTIISEANRIETVLKAMLNLCSRMWLKSRPNLVFGLIPLE